MRYQFTARDTARFWAKVNKCGPIPAHYPELGPCWVWTAGTNGKGYGLFGVTRLGAGRGNEYAHRIAYEVAYGPLADGECALHRCDNRGCVRETHLFRGTHADNMRDMTAKGRNVFHTAPELVVAGIRRYFAAHPDARDGTKNGRARLSEADIPTIRASYGDGTNGVRLVDLAVAYGVTIQTIWAVIKRRTWSHVP